MKLPEKWIWLNSEKYPDCQNTNYSGFSETCNYTVAEFLKQYSFGKKVHKTELRFSGDTAFELYLNGNIIATGPVPVGGDFLGNDLPRGQHYASELVLYPDCDTLDFFARVKMGPVGIYEYSQGHGGFMLACRVTFDDGTKTVLTTDESWLARKNGAYVKPYAYDGRIPADDYTPAQVIHNIWHSSTAPLPALQENVIMPKSGELVVLSGETKEFTVEYDKIYAAILGMQVKTNGLVEIEVTSLELQIDERSRHESLVFVSDGEYRGLQVHSVGALKIKITNKSDSDVIVLPKIIACCYPVDVCAKTVTSDEDLNLILDVCTHTLQYCRQHIHLDSPCHYEPLACTGDYYVESLMTAFSFGDMKLAEFDIIRTAELLRNNNGRMFHTTYSLIWVLMLYDVYAFTADKQLLGNCKDALVMLLRLFETYIGDNGIIETPPDYMFIDWLYVDEISLHHPPKALGQTCLNMFYFGALEKAASIFEILNDIPMAEYCKNKADSLKSAVNEVLFDKEKQMYFEGLNTPTPENLLYHYMPQNTQKRYYRKHANILAAYFGICDKALAKSLLKRIMSDEIEGDYQAYFGHYLLEAIYKNGFREDYTLTVIERWKKIVRECSKGLAEGLIPPEPSYSFDHSHAWGGTPLYSLPLALIGFEMVKPGFEEIKLSPSLLGLDKARVEMPTPYGMITVTLEKGKKPICIIPKEIKVAGVENFEL